MRSKMKRIPIHFVEKQRTVCGVSVTRMIAMTYNPRLVTCLRCRRTRHHIHALGGILRQRKNEKTYTQMPLFTKGEMEK